jgi:hypothetical protein
VHLKGATSEFRVKTTVGQVQELRITASSVTFASIGTTLSNAEKLTVTIPGGATPKEAAVAVAKIELLTSALGTSAFVRARHEDNDVEIKQLIVEAGA